MQTSGSGDTCSVDLKVTGSDPRKVGSTLIAVGVVAIALGAALVITSPGRDAA